MNAPADRNPLSFILKMQIIGCILVIAGHSFPLVSPIPGWALQTRTFIYDFHMAVFVWCSGYLFVATHQNKRHSFREYCKRRAVRILLPYFAFSLIGIVPKILFAGMLNDAPPADLNGIMRAFFLPRGNIWGHFWFLPMIFIFGIIGYKLLAISMLRPSAQGGGVDCPFAHRRNRIFCTAIYRLVRGQ